MDHSSSISIIPSPAALHRRHFTRTCEEEDALLAAAANKRRQFFERHPLPSQPRGELQEPSLQEALALLQSEVAHGVEEVLHWEKHYHRLEEKRKGEAAEVRRRAYRMMSATHGGGSGRRGTARPSAVSVGTSREAKEKEEERKWIASAQRLASQDVEVDWLAEDLMRSRQERHHQNQVELLCRSHLQRYATAVPATTAFLLPTSSRHIYPLDHGEGTPGTPSVSYFPRAPVWRSQWRRDDPHATEEGAT